MPGRAGIPGWVVAVAAVVVLMVVALGVGGYLVLARAPGDQQVGGPSAG